MSNSPSELFDRYVTSLPLPGRDLTSADVETGQRARRGLIELGAAAIPALLDALATPDFTVKDAAYDLVIEIGESAARSAHEALLHEWGVRGPVVDIWIAAALRALGDDTILDRLTPLLTHPDRTVRHLAALALAFGMDDPGRRRNDLAPVLIDALSDEGRIEHTPFTVAGSALAMLTRLAGPGVLVPADQVHLYNDDAFVFPPPVHPFPFAADLVSQASDDEKRRIRERAAAWWDHRTP